CTLGRATRSYLMTALAQKSQAVRGRRNYERAHHYYTQLMRHRMANPLQSIIGMTQVLLDRPDIEPTVRTQFLETVLSEARVLERVCVDPVVTTEVERPLNPWPAAELRVRRREPVC